MLPILIISIVGGLVLLMLALRFPVVASLSKALCTWLAYPLSSLSQASVKTSARCLGVYNICLVGPISAKGTTAEEANPAVRLLFRIFIFFCAVCIFLGDMQLAMYRSASLFGLMSPVVRVLPPEVFAAGAGAMWIGMSALFGILFLELIGVMPKGVHLFSVTSMWTRGIIGVFSFICFLASSMLTALFYAYGQQEILHLTPHPDLAILIVLGFGLLISVVSLLAAWALVIGSAGVVCLFAGALYCALSVLGNALSLAGKIIESFGSIVPSNDLEPPVPHAKPQTTGDEDDPFTLPSPSPSSVTEKKEIEPMTDTKRTLSILGYGSLGTRLLPVLFTGAVGVGAESLLLALGLVDLDRPYQAHPVPSLPRGVRNITPAVTEMMNTQTKVTGGQSVYQSLAEKMQHSLVEVYAEKHADVILVVASQSIIPKISSSLRSLKNRLPGCPIILVTQRAVFEKKEEVSRGLTELEKLSRERVIATAFMLDSQSEEAVTMGVEAMERAVAQTLMGLSVAPIHHEHNPTLAAVANCLGDCEPLTGMSCRILRVARGQPRPLWPLVKLFVPAAGERGKGDYTDLVNQAIAATEAVLEKAGTHTRHEGGLSTPLFVVYSIPLHSSDSKFAQFARDMHAYCATTCRHERAGMTVQPVIISANGIALPGEDRGYRVQVACLYPLHPETAYAAVSPAQPLEKTDGHHAQDVTAEDIR